MAIRIQGMSITGNLVIADLIILNYNGINNHRKRKIKLKLHFIAGVYTIW